MQSTVCLCDVSEEARGRMNAFSDQIPGPSATCKQ